MRVVSNRASMHVTKHGVMPHVKDLLGSRVQIRTYYLRSDASPRCDFLTLASGKETPRSALFRTEAAENIESPRPTMTQNPPARAIGRLYDHVHALGVG